MNWKEFILQIFTNLNKLTENEDKINYKKINKDSDEKYKFFLYSDINKLDNIYKYKVNEKNYNFKKFREYVLEFFNNIKNYKKGEKTQDQIKYINDNIVKLDINEDKKIDNETTIKLKENKTERYYINRTIENIKEYFEFLLNIIYLKNKNSRKRNVICKIDEGKINEEYCNYFECKQDSLNVINLELKIDEKLGNNIADDKDVCIVGLRLFINTEKSNKLRKDLSINKDEYNNIFKKYIKNSNKYCEYYINPEKDEELKKYLNKCVTDTNPIDPLIFSIEEYKNDINYKTDLDQILDDESENKLDKGAFSKYIKELYETLTNNKNKDKINKFLNYYYYDEEEEEKKSQPENYYYYNIFIKDISLAKTYYDFLITQFNYELNIKYKKNELNDDEKKYNIELQKNYMISNIKYIKGKIFNMLHNNKIDKTKLEKIYEEVKNNNTTNKIEIINNIDDKINYINISNKEYDHIKSLYYLCINIWNKLKQQQEPLQQQQQQQQKELLQQQQPQPQEQQTSQQQQPPQEQQPSQQLQPPQEQQPSQQLQKQPQQQEQQQEQQPSQEQQQQEELLQQEQEEQKLMMKEIELIKEELNKLLNLIKELQK